MAASGIFDIFPESAGDGDDERMTHDGDDSDGGVTARRRLPTVVLVVVRANRGAYCKVIINVTHRRDGQSGVSRDGGMDLCYS